MSSVINPFEVLQYSIAGALTTASILEYSLPFAGEVVAVSAFLGTGNTGSDLLVNLTKNSVAVLPTAPAAINSIAVSGTGVSTVTTATAHGLVVGNSAAITSATTAVNNGVFPVLSVLSSTVFNIAAPAGVVQAGAGGNVTLNGTQRLAFANGAAAGLVQNLFTGAPVANGANWNSAAILPPVTPLVAFAVGDKVGLKVDQVGSTVAGSALTATLLTIKK